MRVVNVANDVGVRDRAAFQRRKDGPLAVKIVRGFQENAERRAAGDPPPGVCVLDQKDQIRLTYTDSGSS